MYLLMGFRGATLSTLGLYHYPATITNSSTTVAFATFGTTTGFTSTTVAGVINTFSGRQQVCTFHGKRTDAPDFLDGVFHALCYRLELNFCCFATCLDPLGNERTL
jgi:hypothetical protein